MLHMRKSIYTNTQIQRRLLQSKEILMNERKRRLASTAVSFQQIKSTMGKVQHNAVARYWNWNFHFTVFTSFSLSVAPTISKICRYVVETIDQQSSDCHNIPSVIGTEVHLYFPF